MQTMPRISEHWAGPLVQSASRMSVRTRALLSPLLCSGLRCRPPSRGLLQNAPELWRRREAHGSIRIREGTILARGNYLNMKWVRRILLFALAGFSLIAIFIVGAAYYGAGKIITRTSSDEHRIIHGNPETALGLACEDVSFKAEGRGDAARLVCERSPVPMARAHRHCTRVVCATAQESLK